MWQIPENSWSELALCLGCVLLCISRNCFSEVPSLKSVSKSRSSARPCIRLLLRKLYHTRFVSSAGFAVCVVQLRAGGGSCGQLLQLPELRRVRAVQRPLLRLDRAAVSGRQDGSTWQVRDYIHTEFLFQRHQTREYYSLWEVLENLLLHQNMPI